MRQRIALSVPGDLTVLTRRAEKIKGETESEKRGEGEKKKELKPGGICV